MDIEEDLLQEPLCAKDALLVATYTSKEDKEAAEEHLAELGRLCDTLGVTVRETFLCPLKKIDAGHYLGSGKLEEIAKVVAAMDIGVVIFDNELLPKQQRNLEKIVSTMVMDRTELIIEVFASRAQTREARLQIALAKVQYQFPRLRRMWTHLSRQSAGKGFVKGEGEKQIEIDRRLLRKKVDRLKGEIQEVIAQRDTQRRARERSGIPTFAIIGYTNAGKSTLMKALTGADVYVEDKLFATLDTTTRRFTLPNKQEILFIDTVGFIRKLPHTLIAAFKSTLEEAVYADILVHLIDVSHPFAKDHAQATKAVLQELGAEGRPTIVVFNKVDLCEDSRVIESFLQEEPNAVVISALQGKGIDQLLERMIRCVASLRKIVHVRIPQKEYKVISELMQDGKVLESSYEENDVLLMMEIPSHVEYKIAPYLIGR